MGKSTRDERPDLSRKDRAQLVQNAAAAAAAQAAENASWQEDDKGLLRKSARAADKDAKSDAKLAAKIERRNLENVENELVSGKAKQGPAKVTQAEVARRQALAASAAKPKKAAKSRVVPQPELEPNWNHQQEVIVASGMDACLAAVDGGGCAALCGPTSWKDYERRVSVEVRDDNPQLKESQIQEKVRKMWARSPENPRLSLR